MKIKRFLPFCFLLSWMILILVGCERPTQDLSLEKIKADLVGVQVAGLEDGSFTITDPGYVELGGIRYDGRHADVEVSVKALNVKESTGIEGTLGITYEFKSGQWWLKQASARDAEPLPAAYAGRLSELVDFPLHYAANLGDLERVKSELQKGVAVDSPEARKASTALMFAAERGYLEIVKTLQANGADCNYQNNKGFAALHGAASNDMPEVVQFLVEKHADVNLQDQAGRTPLFFAVERGSLGLAKYLVEQGADPNIKSRRNWTSLYSAVKNNSLEMTRYLIEQGAEVNVEMEDGISSPLLIAAYNNNAEMVELLLAAGADPMAKMSNHHSRFKGLTALDIAKQEDNQEVAELLQAKVAN